MVVVDKRLLLLSASLGLTFISMVFVIIGLCTNNWVELRDRNLYRNNIMVHFGLHRICWVNNDRCNNPGNDYDQQNMLPAVQGLLITGGFLCVFATLLALFNFLQDQLGKSHPLISIANASVACIAGILVLVSVIVFAVKVKVRTEYITVGHYDFLGYSFGLTTTAGILMLGAAALSGLTAASSATPKFNM